MAALRPAMAKEKLRPSAKMALQMASTKSTLRKSLGWPLSPWATQ
jgi:hypothetical protein